MLNEPPDDPGNHKSPTHPSHTDDQDGPPLWAMAGAGIELAAVVTVMLLIGKFLDRYFGTDPWLLVTGAAIGFIGGLYNLIKRFKRFL